MSYTDSYFVSDHQQNLTMEPDAAVLGLLLDDVTWKLFMLQQGFLIEDHLQLPSWIKPLKWRETAKRLQLLFSRYSPYEYRVYTHTCIIKSCKSVYLYTVIWVCIHTAYGRARNTQVEYSVVLENYCIYYSERKYRVNVD